MHGFYLCNIAYWLQTRRTAGISMPLVVIRTRKEAPEKAPLFVAYRSNPHYNRTFQTSLTLIF